MNLVKRISTVAMSLLTFGGVSVGLAEQAKADCYDEFIMYNDTAYNMVVDVYVNGVYLMDAEIPSGGYNEAWVSTCGTLKIVFDANPGSGYTYREFNTNNYIDHVDFYMKGNRIDGYMYYE